MGYQIGSITGNVLDGITKGVQSEVDCSIMKPVTGTTYTRIWSKYIDISNIDYIDLKWVVDNDANQQNFKLIFDTATTLFSDTNLNNGTETKYSIDCTSATGEGILEIQIANTTAGQITRVTSMNMNLRAG